MRLDLVSNLIERGIQQAQIQTDSTRNIVECLQFWINFGSRRWVFETRSLTWRLTLKSIAE